MCVLVVEVAPCCRSGTGLHHHQAPVSWTVFELSGDGNDCSSCLVVVPGGPLQLGQWRSGGQGCAWLLDRANGGPACAGGSIAVHAARLEYRTCLAGQATYYSPVTCQVNCHLALSALVTCFCRRAMTSRSWSSGTRSCTPPPRPTTSPSARRTWPSCTGTTVALAYVRHLCVRCNYTRSCHGKNAACWRGLRTWHTGTGGAGVLMYKEGIQAFLLLLNHVKRK